MVLNYFQMALKKDIVFCELRFFVITLNQNFKMKYIIFLGTFLIFAYTNAQNVNVIDAIAGVGEYKWGMTKEQSNCTEDEYGWCNYYPGNFFIGNYQVSTIKTAINEKTSGTYIKGIYWIELYLKSNSKTDFDQIAKELTVKYGKTTTTSNDGDYFSWSGNYVTVSIRYLFEDNQNKIVIWYFKTPTKTQVGF